jgi:hypothetical protein
VRYLPEPFTPAWLRRRLLVRRLRAPLAALERTTAPEQLTLEMMEELVAAWGNPSYSGDAGYLLHLGRLIRSGSGPVLDCGSGLSTLVAAKLAARRGEMVWSLEQHREWYEHLAGVVRGLGIGNVRLWYAPLRPFADFVWYDLEGRSLPPRFGLVACDGPAVHRSRWPPPLFQAWRVGVVPRLQQLGIPFDHILLDDEVDQRASGVMARWESSGLSLEVVETPTGRHILGTPASPPG